MAGRGVSTTSFFVGLFEILGVVDIGFELCVTVQSGFIVAQLGVVVQGVLTSTLDGVDIGFELTGAIVATGSGVCIPTSGRVPAWISACTFA